jgi:hypothetical protein
MEQIGRGRVKRKVFFQGACPMKAISFALAAVFVIAHGPAWSAPTVPPSDLKPTGTYLEPRNIAGSDSSESANENRADDKGIPSNENKSEKDKGVIKPEQGVDPGIVRPAPVPDPNSMRVITPPGTPGGAPGPEPK